jgi:ferrous iron transport protein A
MPATVEPFRPKRMTLIDLPIGATGRVCALAGENNVCARLRELGFCESVVVEKIAGHKTLLCHLCGIRIALSESAAAHIVVELMRGRSEFANVC